MNQPYKVKHSFEERVAKVKHYAETDSDKMLIIVEKHPKSKLPDLANSKYHSNHLDSSPTKNSSFCKSKV